MIAYQYQRQDSPSCFSHSAREHASHPTHPLPRDSAAEPTQNPEFFRGCNVAPIRLKRAFTSSEACQGRRSRSPSLRLALL